MPPVDIPPLECALSADSRTLALMFDGNLHEYNAQQVETLMQFLYLRRAQMQPPVAQSFDQSEPDRVLVADAYQVKTMPDLGAAAVWMQLAGFGWAVAQIPAATAAELGRALLALGDHPEVGAGETDTLQ